MKYVVTGGAGHISRPLVEQLLKAGHDVTVIGRNEENLKPLTDKGAKAAIGSVEDVSFLTDTFKGADAVYTMVPPTFDTTDWIGHIGRIGENYAQAIKDSGVKNVVNLSSVGAHLPDGVGPVSGLYRAEQALNNLDDVNIRHLRPAYFYHNLLSNVGLIKQAGIIGGNFSVSGNTFPIVHPQDIASAAAEELTQDFKGHSIRYIAGDEVSTDGIASAIGKEIGKPDLKWVPFTDDQTFQGMTQAGLPEEIAKNYVEMGQSINSGVMSADYFKNHPELSKTKLGDFAKEFAQVYNAG
jgi:uncharacterized protein YbjT (DUF2867 family)